MNHDGEVVASKTTGENSINTREWIRESFTFTNYPKGVRIIAFESSGNYLMFQYLIIIIIGDQKVKCAVKVTQAGYNGSVDSQMFQILNKDIVVKHIKIHIKVSSP